MPRSLRAHIECLVLEENVEALDVLVSQDRRSVRHLVSLTYSADERIRRCAARGVALAGHHHPKLVDSVIRRFIWAMNDESGTNGVTAPDVICAIADESPELLLAVVPDLIRLSGESSLHEGLSAALRSIVRKFPGEISQRLGRSLSDQLRK